jgi:hypothetical protein
MSEYVIGWCSWVTSGWKPIGRRSASAGGTIRVLPERLRGRTLTLVGIGEHRGRNRAGGARSRHARGRRQPHRAPACRTSTGVHRTGARCTAR